MSNGVIVGIVGVLIFGLVLGALIGTTVGEDTLVGWMVLTAMGGTLFFGLWGYTNEQNRNVQHAGDKPKKTSNS